MTTLEAAPIQSELERLANAVDLALEKIDKLDEGPKKAALDLKDALEAFHRPALVHMVQTLKADDRGKELLFYLVDDPIVRAIFGLHGIIKPDPMTRANQALESVRPYLQSHGGDVELVRIEDSVAYVRLHGSCNGCSMSAVTLREGVEEALVTGVSEVSSISVLEDEPTVAFIPLDSIGRKSPAESGWIRGPETASIDSDSLQRFDVNNPATGIESFVAAKVDNRISVFRNECVHQGLTLDGGSLEDGCLVCPWHGFTFDASSGECISAPGAQLQQVPTRMDGGHLWIRLEGEG